MAASCSTGWSIACTALPGAPQTDDIAALVLRWRP
jgi:hypothetical protein